MAKAKAYQTVEAIEVQNKAKFEVRLLLEVVAVNDDGVQSPFFCSDVAYHNLPRAGMLLVEATLLAALRKLHEAGVAMSQDEELPQLLDELGL